VTKVSELPARPNLDYLKKVAKQQLAASRKKGKASSLAAMQLALARHYGFPSWRKLKSYVEQLEAESHKSLVLAQEPASPETFDAVMKAITSRDTDALKQLLAASPGVVNQTGPHPRWGGRPQPLHVAIESDNAPAFKLLLDAGADVNGDNRHYDGWSPLMIAMNSQHNAMRQELLRRGARIDLIASLMLRDDRRVAKLLKDPSALRGPFPNDATPLHFARTTKSARLLLARGVDISAKDKYGNTPPQTWANSRHPLPALKRLAESLGRKVPLDIFKAVQQGAVKQVRKLLAAGTDVNSRFPDGAGQTLLHAAAWNGDLPLAKLLVAKGADIHALDHEYNTTPAHWARVALKSFNRYPCEPVAEYLEGLMNAAKTSAAPSLADKVPAAKQRQQGTKHNAASTLGKFRTLFPILKSRFEETHSAADGLVCKQGFYKDCVVLKLQKSSWTNDPMEQLENKSGIFFSIWANAASIRVNRLNYNIHALKLRQLKGYSISSRDFADEFRHLFGPFRKSWPNVDLYHGPLTLMQGWIELSPDSAEAAILALLQRFATELSPLIDRLLASRRN
jgi:ankyrin repeat protein